MKKISSKHEEILKLTTKMYIEQGDAISSSKILDHYKLNMSSAKIRYLMNDLENEGYLEKAYSSSGRIPTIKGLDYYARFLSQDEESNMLKKLRKLFHQRKNNIDNTVDEAAKIITEATGLTIVTVQSNSNALLKSIQLVPLSESSATVVLVISTGEVFSKMIYLNTSKNEIEDLRIAIRLFKERLVDVPIYQLAQRALSLKSILAQAVHNYEDLFESFIENVFQFQTQVKTNVYGRNNIILSEDISREQLHKMLNMLENQSIWELIESEQKNDDERLKISVDSDGAFLSKKLELDNQVTEITIIGATKSDYASMRGAICLLEELVRTKNDSKDGKNDE